MPYKPHERFYRSFAASAFQPAVDESRDGEQQEPSYRVKGYYTTWNTEYLLFPAVPSLDWPAEYEQVDRHALDGADISDVIFQENHEGSPLARIRNGSLELGEDEHGAWCIADLGGCQRGREIYESIRNGLIVEMSFGFTIADDDDGRGMTSTRDEQGEYHTTITRIGKIFDVSCVSIPANPFTDISELRQRSAAAATIEADRKAAEEAAEAEERAVQEAVEAERRQALEMLKLRARAMGLAD